MLSPRHSLLMLLLCLVPLLQHAQEPRDSLEALASPDGEYFGITVPVSMYGIPEAKKFWNRVWLYRVYHRDTLVVQYWSHEGELHLLHGDEYSESLQLHEQDKVATFSEVRAIYGLSRPVVKRPLTEVLDVRVKTTFIAPAITYGCGGSPAPRLSIVRRSKWTIEKQGAQVYLLRLSVVYPSHEGLQSRAEQLDFYQMRGGGHWLVRGMLIYHHKSRFYHDRRAIVAWGS